MFNLQVTKVEQNYNWYEFTVSFDSAEQYLKVSVISSNILSWQWL